MNHAWMSEDDGLSGCLVCGAVYAEDRIAAEVLRCTGRADLIHGDCRESGCECAGSGDDGLQDGGACGRNAAVACDCDCDLCRG